MTNTFTFEYFYVYFAVDSVSTWVDRWPTSRTTNGNIISMLSNLLNQEHLHITNEGCDRTSFGRLPSEVWQVVAQRRWFIIQVVCNINRMCTTDHRIWKSHADWDQVSFIKYGICREVLWCFESFIWFFKFCYIPKGSYSTYVPNFIIHA